MAAKELPSDISLELKVIKYIITKSTQVVSYNGYWYYLCLLPCINDICKSNNGINAGINDICKSNNGINDIFRESLYPHEFRLGLHRLEVKGFALNDDRYYMAIIRQTCSFLLCKN